MRKHPITSLPIALTFAMLLACTQQAPPTESDCPLPTLSELLPLLDQRLDTVHAFPCMALADTTIDSDEGVTWPAKAFLWKGEAAFLAEASWGDRAHIQRVTVSSPLIRLGEIYVGQTFAAIRAAADEDIPVSPDGYLFVQSKADSRIHMQLDISQIPFDSPLHRGELDLAQLPGDLVVEAIVIH